MDSNILREHRPTLYWPKVCCVVTFEPHLTQTVLAVTVMLILAHIQPTLWLLYPMSGTLCDQRKPRCIHCLDSVLIQAPDDQNKERWRHSSFRGPLIYFLISPLFLCSSYSGFVVTRLQSTSVLHERSRSQIETSITWRQQITFGE